MKKLLDIRTLTILVLVAVLLMKQCGYGGGNEDIETINVDGKEYELLKHDVDTQFVETITEVTKYVPQYITKVDVDTVEIPMDADTLAIIEDYFSTYAVDDTLKLDGGLGWVFVQDQITQNKLKSREFKANVKERTITDTKIVKELPKNEFYWGIGGGFNQTQVINNIGLDLTWKSKKNQLYQLGFGVSQDNQQLVPVVNAGLQWKIGGKKKK
jgi:hypothetical protein